jgi:4-hydroxybenzoate polyprenyltransferase
MRNWLKFFRVVNLPTVPGDILAGAAVLCSFGGLELSAAPLAAACAASVFIYMFGLADNDIVGAATDVGRPIPDGVISIRTARIARGLCLFAVLVIGSAFYLQPAWWMVAFLLAVCIVVYNRTKWCLAMGLCRGLNAMCGVAAVATDVFSHTGESIGRVELLALCAIWTAYIAAVTRYSEGEAGDPAKRQRVGLLVGGMIYLQLVALLICNTTPLLLAGAFLLIALRLLKRLLPEIGAS